MLEKVVVVQYRRGSTLGSPCGTDVYHNGGDHSDCCVCVPQREIVSGVHLVSAGECLFYPYDSVFDGILHEGLYNGTDSSGLTVLLDHLVEHVVRVKSLICETEEVSSLEGPYRVTHLECGSLLEYRGECDTLHGVPAYQGDHVVGHDVPESVACTLIVLREIKDGSEVRSGESDGLRVSSPYRALDHVGLVHRYVELVDNRLNRRSSSRGETSRVLDTGAHSLFRCYHNQALSARFDFNNGLIAVVHLDHVLDRSCDLFRVLDKRYVDLFALYLSSAAADHTGLESLLNTGEVDSHGPLGHSGNPFDCFVAQRTYGFKGHILRDALSPVVIQVYYVLVFWHFIPPFYIQPNKRQNLSFPLAIFVNE